MKCQALQSILLGTSVVCYSWALPECVFDPCNTQWSTSVLQCLCNNATKASPGVLKEWLRIQCNDVFLPDIQIIRVAGYEHNGWILFIFTAQTQVVSFVQKNEAERSNSSINDNKWLVYFSPVGFAFRGKSCSYAPDVQLG